MLFMITFKYHTGWNKALRNIALSNKGKASIDQYCEKECKTKTPLHVLQQILTNDTSLDDNLPKFMSLVVQYVFNAFDADNTLAGLFQLLRYVNHNRVSPFLATRDFCVRVLSCDEHGKIQLNVSPIYHLGPEYPEYYEEKEGKALSKDAIIGLVEADNNHSDTDDPHTRFKLGIDAGIAFKDAAIPHNKSMLLEIGIVDEGIMANLQCEGQATSKAFTWRTLGMSSTPCTDIYSEKVQQIWAA